MLQTMTINNNKCDKKITQFSNTHCLLAHFWGTCLQQKCKNDGGEILLEWMTMPFVMIAPMIMITITLMTLTMVVMMVLIIANVMA